MNFKFLKNRLKYHAKNIFDKNERLATNVVDPKPTSRFDISFRNLTTFDSGKLIPIFTKECLPGDIWDIDISAIFRLGTPQAATMDNPTYDISFFFIPNRVLWENWKALMGENKNAGFQKDIQNVPLILYDRLENDGSGGDIYNQDDLASYMGFPQNVEMANIGVPISSLWFKAYGKVWNDFYRDQNLQSEIDITNGNKNDNNVSFKEHYSGNFDYNTTVQVGKGLAPVSRLADYFSTALPYPQKGDPVSLEILKLNSLLVGGPIRNTPRTVETQPNTVNNNDFTQSMFRPNFYMDVGISTPNSALPVAANQSNIGYTATIGETNYEVKEYVGKVGTTSVDLRASGDWFYAMELDPTKSYVQLKDNQDTNPLFNINDLRLSIAIQHIRELDARGGTRYTEILLNHFGLSVSDSRLDRAEYIGGWRDIINIGNVVQSSAGNATSPLGVLGGVSVTAANSKNTISYACQEHGIILGFVVVRSNISYSQGLDKQFTRVERFDFYDPELANIGEQPIKKYELYLGPDSESNNSVFGYNEAWADYRYSKNMLTGYLSVNNEKSLSNLYAYTEKYATYPTLSGEWMSYNNKVIGDTQLLNNNLSEYIHQFMADFYFSARVSRKMPMYSIPGLRRI